jgi:hypothetical protein
MANRKLHVIVLAVALLSFALTTESLANCRRHYRRAHRVYGSYTAEPYITSLATATPVAALNLTAPGPEPVAPVNTPLPPMAEAPECPAPSTCCTPTPCSTPSCNTCCASEGDNHHHHGWH